MLMPQSQECRCYICSLISVATYMSLKNKIGGQRSFRKLLMVYPPDRKPKELLVVIDSSDII